MRIFFTATIQGKDKYEKNYRFIVEKLRSLGHKVESGSFFDISNNEFNEMPGSQELLSFHKKVTENIKKCDVFIVDVTYQRVSTGYWLSVALDLGKPCIALYQKGEKYHLLETLELSQKFLMYEYASLTDLEKELPLLVDFAAEQQDTRFNFFISPKHQNYLDWIAKTKKIPRSVYLRQPRETDMTANTDFVESDFFKQKPN